MKTNTKTYLVSGLALLLHFVSAHAQDASLMIGSGAYYVGGNSSYSVIAGDIRTDGNINSTAGNNFSFIGTSQQKITCLAGGGCSNVFNTSIYNTVFGNVNQNNSSGIRIESNAKVLGLHTFNNGATEISEGNYWLANTSATPFVNNNSISRFFVTTAHGLLKRSNIGGYALFPVGTAANLSSYTPLSLAYSGTADNFAVRVMDDIYYGYNNMVNGDPIGLKVYNLSTAFVKKTWIVNKETPVTVLSDGFLAKAEWNAVNEDVNFNHAAAGIDRNHDRTWFPQNALSATTGTGPYAYNAVQVVSYDNKFYPYYPITVSSIISPLLVTGLKLTASLSNNNSVTLNWQTLTEVNSNYFIVEKSVDGINYSGVAKVNATGNSTSSRNYAAVDNNINAIAENILYRIREVDLDGKISYSNVVSVKLTNDARRLISIYPNPALTDIAVHFKNAPGNYVVSVLDNSGRAISQQSVSVSGVLEKISIGRKGLAAGVYFISIINKANGNVQTIMVNVL
ncbi:T9SS type A sorting domain-containing protein [Pinibacter soli]|uniref:T9SS type A sorting domain-containing protein n=1 Tax=Pinibacter soli TaxID=3044211 RepID=A0ABT6RGD7_9BACT|nr:T9SS type A sorting domain-containing protein [Pinibacter soli]MDI3321642.1 T9SS type A sorting domain-containing protein [Pinibacter soli]